jgi:hypothetical protein
LAAFPAASAMWCAPACTAWNGPTGRECPWTAGWKSVMDIKNNKWMHKKTPNSYVSYYVLPKSALVSFFIKTTYQ